MPSTKLPTLHHRACSVMQAEHIWPNSDHSDCREYQHGIKYFSLPLPKSLETTAYRQVGGLRCFKGRAGISRNKSPRMVACHTARKAKLQWDLRRSKNRSMRFQPGAKYRNSGQWWNQNAYQIESDHHNFGQYDASGRQQGYYPSCVVCGSAKV